MNSTCSPTPAHVNVQMRLLLLYRLWVVKRSQGQNLRPIFLFGELLCGHSERGLKTAAAHLRSSGLEAPDSLMW